MSKSDKDSVITGVNFSSVWIDECVYASDKGVVIGVDLAEPGSEKVVEAEIKQTGPGEFEVVGWRDVDIPNGAGDMIRTEGVSSGIYTHKAEVLKDDIKALKKKRQEAQLELDALRKEALWNKAGYETLRREKAAAERELEELKKKEQEDYSRRQMEGLPRRSPQLRPMTYKNGALGFSDEGYNADKEGKFKPISKAELNAKFGPEAMQQKLERDFLADKDPVGFIKEDPEDPFVYVNRNPDGLRRHLERELADSFWGRVQRFIINLLTFRP